MSSGSTDNSPRRVSRARLARLRDELLEPLKSTPPTIGTYPRELDLELFRLFAPHQHELVQQEKRVTLGGRDLRPPRDEWGYVVHRHWMSEAVGWTPEGCPIVESGWSYPGEVQEDGTFVRKPDVYEVPHYTSIMDDAFDLKIAVIGLGRRLVIEEVEDEFVPRWRAKMVVSGQGVAQGETYDCAASIVLVVLSDLLENEGASWWIEVTAP